MGNQSLMQCRAGVEEVDGAAIRQGILPSLNRSLTYSVEYFFPQAGDQNTVLQAELFYRAKQFVVVFVAQVGDQDHQGAAFLPSQQLAYGGAVVGGALGTSQVIDAAEQSVQLGSTFDRCQIPVLLASKGRNPYRVAWRRAM